MKNNNSWTKALGLLSFIIGIVLAWLILQPLAALPERTDATQKKDTLFVQLLNAGNRLDTPFGQITKKIEPPTTIAPSSGVRRPDTSSAFLKVGSATIPAYTGIPVRRSMIDSLSKNSVWLTGDTTRNFIRLLIPVVLCMLVIAGIIYVYRLPEVNSDFAIEVDPELLRKTFDECGPLIKAMRNPRRIKRFSNKLRFHYYFINAPYAKRSHVIPYEDILDTARILLYLEAHPLLMEIDDRGTPGTLKDATWFYSAVVSSVPDLSKPRSAADPLIQILFQLNNNVIV